MKLFFYYRPITEGPLLLFRHNFGLIAVEIKNYPAASQTKFNTCCSVIYLIYGSISSLKIISSSSDSSDPESTLYISLFGLNGGNFVRLLLCLGVISYFLSCSKLMYD